MNNDTKVLDEIDFATLKEDKVCITRDHENGTLAWRFASPKADPIGLMVRVLVMQILHDNGIFERLDTLEKRMAELEAVK